MKQLLSLIALIFLSTNLWAQQHGVTPQIINTNVTQTGIQDSLLLLDTLGKKNNFQNDYIGDEFSSFSRIININEFTAYSSDEPSFEPSRYKLRGYGSRYAETFINNIPTNNLESGYASEFILDGLNDVSKIYKKYSGLNSSDCSYGSIGGHKQVDLRASNHAEGNSMTYSNSNGKYKNRLMYTYSSGLMQNGWAFTASGSKRWANEGYVEGTSFDAYSYLLAIEKKISTNQYIAFTILGSPVKSGEQGATTQEVYNLTDTNYYNPYWGWQEGRKRNSRIRSVNKPVFVLNHNWEINPKTILSGSASYIYGKSKQSALNWFNAMDPRPDFYRYLPSYMTIEEQINIRTQEFANGERQIEWDSFYETNLSTIDTIINANGSGEEFTGYRSDYFVENRHYDEQQLSLNMMFEKLINENVTIISCLQHQNYKGSHYKTIDDLLGGDFILDDNKYAIDAFPVTGLSDFNDIASNDIRTPNRIVEDGDRFGYDYDSNIRNTEARVQTKFTYSKIDFNFAVKFVNTTFWRTGNMQTGLYPDNSLGDSEKKNFIDYSVKTGIVYKLNKTNQISVNSEYLTNAPYFSNAFLTVTQSNDFVNDLKSEKIFALNVGYKLKLERITASANYYYTNFQDQATLRNYYSHEVLNFINLSMTQIHKINQGCEFTLEGKISSKLTARAIAALGHNKWVSSPSIIITLENTHDVLIENAVPFLNGFDKQGSEQMAATMGLEYKSLNNWLLGLNANYFDDIYVSFNPAARDAGMEEYFEISSSEYLYQEFIYPDKLPHSFTADFFVGKSMTFYNKYLLSLTLNINNILNNLNFISGGYERTPNNYSGSSLNMLQPKYYYNYGTTYFLNLSLKF